MSCSIERVKIAIAVVLDRSVTGLALITPIK